MPVSRRRRRIGRSPFLESQSRTGCVAFAFGTRACADRQHRRAVAAFSALRPADPETAGVRLPCAGRAARRAADQRTTSELSWRPAWPAPGGRARSFRAPVTCNNCTRITVLQGSVHPAQSKLSHMQSLSAELARSVLDAAPDAMIIVDEAGTVCFANRQVSSLFGYSRDQVIGMDIEQLMPERFRRRHVAHRQEYEQALRSRAMGEGLALFGRRVDGSEFPVEISLSPIRTPEQLLIAAAIRDVSDRKRVEKELRVARESSERARQAADHLRAIADEARESADRANQAKSRFLATASHDLRQPLQTLALLNGILRRVVGEPSALEALAQQEQAIGAMTRLLGALLDISKLESGAIKPELADFRVGTLFEGLRREFTSIAASKGLELQVTSCEECVHSDPALIEQILKNLLSNAIKYTQAGGRVLLRGRSESGSERLEVVDTGIGIAADQLAYIYDEFYQVDVPTNSSREGYGLGLSIVQRLVRLLNLRLEVSSEVGKGSVFSLLLPIGHSLGARPQ